MNSFETFFSYQWFRATHQINVFLFKAPILQNAPLNIVDCEFWLQKRHYSPVRDYWLFHVRPADVASGLRFAVRSVTSRATAHKNKCIIWPCSQACWQLCARALHSAHTLCISGARQLLRLCFGLMPWLGRTRSLTIMNCESVIYGATVPHSASIWPIRGRRRCLSDRLLTLLPGLSRDDGGISGLPIRNKSSVAGGIQLDWSGAHHVNSDLMVLFCLRSE